VELRTLQRRRGLKSRARAPICNGNAIRREASAMSVSAISPVPAAVSPQARPHASVRHMAELPDAPKPVTPATAAVHIMKVPSSRVIEAFVSLQRALGQQSQAPLAAQPPIAPRALTEPAPRPAIDLDA
jgi:hypothetical protein